MIKPRIEQLKPIPKEVERYYNFPGHVYDNGVTIGAKLVCSLCGFEFGYSYYLGKIYVEKNEFDRAYRQVIAGYPETNIKLQREINHKIYQHYLECHPGSFEQKEIAFNDMQTMRTI